LNNPRFSNENDFDTLQLNEVSLKLSKLAEKNTESAPSHTGELWNLIEGMLGSVIGVLGASGGIVRVVSPDSKMLHIAGAVGLPSEVCEDESIVDIGCGVCGQAADNRKIHSADTKRCAKRSSRNFSGAGCEFIVAAPLEYKEELIGVCTLFFAAAENIPHDIELSMRPFSELIGIALDSARKKMGSHRIQLMTERQTLANEIHDSLAHTLYYAKMRMSLLLEALRTNNEELALKCAQDVDEALGNSQKTTREIITHFRCQMDPLGLQHALQALVDRFRKYTGITVTYTNLVANLELHADKELQVYFIVREAMANVAAHSKATNVSLTVERTHSHYIFTILDNGAGYVGSPCDGHYGLMIMRERALRVGGEIEMQSAENNGTSVQLKFPVN
jgi:two-component system nitrate/nitrite sensor histidine kinase NarX